MKVGIVGISSNRLAYRPVINPKNPKTALVIKTEYVKINGCSTVIPAIVKATTEAMPPATRARIKPPIIKPNKIAKLPAGDTTKSSIAWWYFSMSIDEARLLKLSTTTIFIIKPGAIKLI